MVATIPVLLLLLLGIYGYKSGALSRLAAAANGSLTVGGS